LEESSRSGTRKIIETRTAGENKNNLKNEEAGMSQQMKIDRVGSTQPSEIKNVEILEQSFSF